MAHDICQELREISERLLRVSDIDTDQIKTLQDISSAISAQVAVQSTCAETIKSIKEGNTPVRRITFNVKRLSDGSKESAPRWSKLQDLDFNSMVFCLLSFSAIVALPAVQFDWLVCNVKSYLETQGFSKSITEIAQVRRVIMNTPKHEKTKAFLEGMHISASLLRFGELSRHTGYHKSEIEIANEPEPPQKRRLVGGMSKCISNT